MNFSILVLIIMTFALVSTIAIGGENDENYSGAVQGNFG
ncbi:hypothetical protein OKW24_003343 [Peribacillus simplex]|nr:hypothetical protein [Peribacillus simplex]